MCGRHWPYNLAELTWLLDLCFGWKAAAPGREVILLGGDIHVGVDSLITDEHTRTSIRHLTTSPITNNPGVFHCEHEGRLSERYTYTHTPLEKAHNYASLDIRLEGDVVRSSLELVGIAKPSA